MRLNEIDRKAWNGFIWLSTEQLAGSCKRGNATFGYHKVRDFLTIWGNISLSKKVLPHAISFATFHRGQPA